MKISTFTTRQSTNEINFCITKADPSLVQACFYKLSIQIYSVNVISTLSYLAEINKTQKLCVFSLFLIFFTKQEGSSYPLHAIMSIEFSAVSFLSVCLPIYREITVVVTIFIFGKYIEVTLGQTDRRRMLYYFFCH